VSTRGFPDVTFFLEDPALFHKFPALFQIQNSNFTFEIPSFGVY